MNTKPELSSTESLEVLLEYHLLEGVQNGDRNALRLLTVINLWFLKRLARTYAPEGNDKVYEKKLNDLVHLLEVIAPLVLQSTTQVCLLESVYIVFCHLEENPEERMSPRDCQKYLETALALNPASLDMPLKHDGDTTLGELLVGNHPHYEEMVWPTQVRTCIREHLADSRFTNLDRQPLSGITSKKSPLTKLLLGLINLHIMFETKSQRYAENYGGDSPKICSTSHEYGERCFNTTRNGGILFGTDNACFSMDVQMHRM